MLDCWRFGHDDLQGWALGLPLEPLSLGHIFLLRDYDVDALEPKDFGELLLTVFVCSQPWRESKAALGKLRTRLFLAWWGFRVRKLVFTEQVKLFVEYLQRNIAHPEFIISENQKDCGSPLPFRLLGIATRMLHQPWDKAHDIPVRMLMAVWAAAAEMRGEIQLWSESQEELLQYAREQDALKQKESNGTAAPTV